MANPPNRTRQAERTQEPAAAPAEPVGSRSLAVTTSRLPITPEFAKTLELTHSQWANLVDDLFPAAKTAQAVVRALNYCRARNLDVFKKPVHIVPMWSSTLNRMVETIWPGIAEIRTKAARTG